MPRELCSMVNVWKRKNLKHFKVAILSWKHYLCGPGVPPCLGRFPQCVVEFLYLEVLETRHLWTRPEGRAAAGYESDWVHPPPSGPPTRWPHPNEAEGLNLLTLKLLRCTFVGWLNRPRCGPEGVWNLSDLRSLLCHPVPHPDEAWFIAILYDNGLGSFMRVPGHSVSVLMHHWDGPSHQSPGVGKVFSDCSEWHSPSPFLWDPAVAASSPTWITNTVILELSCAC